MNKNVIVTLIVVLALILGFFIGRTTSNRYYFMKETYSDAIAVIRCDQMTGEIELIAQTKEGPKTIKMK
ncbi:MAG: hypothetical protein ABIC39_04455 [Pseudomonadota bacterium]